MSPTEETELLSGFPSNEVSELPPSAIPTEPGSSEPLKILVFPPKNKQFHFDEITSSIQIQPIESTPIASANNQNITTLTPLVEKFDLNAEPLNFDENQPNIQQVVKIEKCFKDSRLGKDCFLKGCEWSADGLCLLTNSEDSILRLFEITENLFRNPQDVEPVLQMKEGGTVYDCKWYPLMNSSDPVSCVFACTSQDSPIHLWDAYTGKLRATYQPINQYDEVTSAYSLAFSPDGSKLYSGFKKCLRIFDVSLPGRVSEERNLKTKGNSVFQGNIISTICINPAMPSLYAMGSYDKSIGIYAEPEGDLICILRGHSGGITQIKFSSNGHYLFSGGRKDDEILCWDMRNPGKIVFSIRRRVETQQRIQFDLSQDQRHLASGTTDCNVNIYDVSKSPNDGIVLEPNFSWKAHDDCVNGIQFHPNLPIFASTSGQRHLPVMRDDDEDDDNGVVKTHVENCVKIWRFDTLS